MENSHSETRLILSLSLQDIDNLAKDLKPRQRMFRFFSLLRHAAETDGTQTKRGIGYSIQTGQVGASHSELGKLGVVNHHLAGQDFNLLSLAYLYQFRFAFSKFYKRHEAFHAVNLVLLAA